MPHLVGRQSILRRSTTKFRCTAIESNLYQTVTQKEDFSLPRAPDNGHNQFFRCVPVETT